MTLKQDNIVACRMSCGKYIVRLSWLNEHNDTSIVGALDILLCWIYVPYDGQFHCFNVELNSALKVRFAGFVGNATNGYASYLAAGCGIL